jgi:hypothetical protein
MNDDTDEDPMLKATREAPLAPDDCQLTSEERADIDRRMADVREGRAKTFTTGEMAAGVVRKWRSEPAPTDPEDAAALVYFEGLVAAECKERGITEAELLAIADEKHAFNKAAGVE